MAVFAPMPRARVSTATAVKPGFFSNWRKANLRSFMVRCQWSVDSSRLLIPHSTFRIPHSNHSYLSASIGSTLAARRAGSQQAASATTLSESKIAINVSRSVGGDPKEETLQQARRGERSDEADRNARPG